MLLEKYSSLGDAFQDVAARQSQQCAIRTLTVDWSYDDLNARSKAIASVIMDQTKGRGRIALYYNSGPEAIAAILGVLLSGNAFVSLDPSDQSHRINHILEDCEPLLVLTNNGSPEVKQLLKGHKTIDTSDLIGRSVRPIEIQIEPEDLACIFYTSGSTGKPKGVTQTHRIL